MMDDIELSKEIYDKGYSDGFEDACKQLSEMAKQLTNCVGGEE